MSKENKSQKNRLIGGVLALILAGILIFFTIPYFQIMEMEGTENQNKNTSAQSAGNISSSEIKIASPTTEKKGKVPMKNLVSYLKLDGSNDVKKSLKISVEKEMSAQKGKENSDVDLILSIIFDVTNQTEKDIEVSHTDGRNFGYIIYNKNGEKIYDDATDHAYTMALSSSIFPVNEEKEFSVSLKEKDMPFKFADIGNIEAFIPNSGFKLNIEKEFSF